MARSEQGRKQVANGKKGGGTPKRWSHLGAAGGLAGATRRTPQRGSGANPVQRMGIGSVYDKVKLSAPPAAWAAPSGGSSSGGSSGGGGYISRGGGGGGGYTGPSAAELAAQQAALMAAYRKQIMDTYVGPSDRLFQSGIDAADSDKMRARQAFDQARYRNDNYAVERNQAADTRESGRQDAAALARMRMGLGGEQGLNKAVRSGAITGTQGVVRRNKRAVTATADSMHEMYQTQKDNAVGRVTGYQDELRRQQALSRKQIANQYGITI